MAARRALAVLLSAAAAASAFVVVGVASAPTAAAVTGSQWNAGSIISDSVFYDFGTMDAGQVQGFLNDKGSGCQAANGISCLKNYSQATQSRGAESGLCAGYTGSGSENAAAIIVNVARSCRINPRSLLVLLEKESSIVTRTTPSAVAYRSATGYGCPDTAACDSTYYGFFNQVYMAARQFKLYALYPTSYGYQAGRVNSILYNPDAGCGSSGVYIANQATAGLYTYTPYQPNSAALNNLYGTGDGCSAYGNRNFWRTFSDWFGDTQTGSYLLRTAADATVYLVSGQTRYAVADLATLSALAPLGNVAVVSADYLGGFALGRTLGRFVRGPDGAVYLFDGTGLHQAPTCAMVSDFGDDCANTVALTSTQVALFRRSSPLAQTVSTLSGKTFWMVGGTKREAFDNASLAQAGMGGPRVALDEVVLAARPYGPPVLRDDVLAVSRADASVWLSRNGGLTNVPRSINTQNVWSRQLATGLLDPNSINALGHDVPYNGFVRSVDHARYYLITPTSRRDITDPAQWTTSWASFSDALLGKLTDPGPLTSPGYLKGTSTDVVVRLTATVARPVSSFPALQALNSGTTPAITTVADDVASALPAGPRLLQPGGLVLDPGTNALSVVDGTTRLVHLPSFETAENLGLPSTWNRLAPGDAAAYPSAAADLSTLVTCGSATYLGNGGTLQRLGRPTAVPATALSSLTCSALDPATTSTASQNTVSTEVFARAERDSTVYRVTTAGKQPVSSWGSLVALNGGNQNPVIAVVAASLLSPLPTGAAL